MLDCSQNWTSKAKMICQSPPEFVRSVTPIGTRVGRFCPSHYCQPPGFKKLHLWNLVFWNSFSECLLIKSLNFFQSLQFLGPIRLQVRNLRAWHDCTEHFGFSAYLYDETNIKECDMYIGTSKDMERLHPQHYVQILWWSFTSPLILL